MHLSRLSLLLLWGLSTICFRAQTGSTVKDSIFSGGQQRYFHVYIPLSYNGNMPVPLVLNLHGLASNALQQQAYSEMTKVADTAGFLLVHPEGSMSGSTQFWNPGLLGAPDDVAFLTALIDTISGNYQVDQSAVYSCGLSNGAVMSFYLACQRPLRFAAIASVAGTMFSPWFNTCNPTFAMPVMVIHGSEDGTVPYEGNSGSGTAGLYVPIDSVVQKWVRKNQCNFSPQVTQLPDLVTSDLSTVTHYVYSGGVDASSVELYKVNGGSHSWPGALPVIYKTNQDFNASAEIWRFFRKYRNSQFTSPLKTAELAEERIRIYPNPVRDELHLEVVKQDCMYSIYSVDGRLKRSGACSETIDFRAMDAGIYFIMIAAGSERHFRKIVKE